MDNYLHDFCKVLKSNIYAIITGDFKEGTTDINKLGNLAIMRIDRKTITPTLKGVPYLTKQQKSEIKKIFGPHIKHMSDRYHRIYTHESGGKFFPEYLPEDIFAMDVDRYFNHRAEATYLDNKCYYYRMFPHVKQPELVIMRIGHCWVDANHKLISRKKVLEILSHEPEVVVKRAVISGGGFGVTFLSGPSLLHDFTKLIRKIPCDVVIQRSIHQHECLKKLHPESVNTVRVITLLTNTEVKIYGVMLRIGVGKSNVDNSAMGGVVCGVDNEGTVSSYGNMHDGRRIYTHPDLGYKFGEQKITGIDKIFQLAKDAHEGLGHFRLVAWDIALDETGKAVLIEANFSFAAINCMQVCSGPLFGKDTKKILAEVYQGKRRKWTTLL